MRNILIVSLIAATTVLVGCGQGFSSAGNGNTSQANTTPISMETASIFSRFTSAPGDHVTDPNDAAFTTAVGIPVQFDCSDWNSENLGNNVQNDSSFALNIVNGAGSTVCSLTDASILKNILSQQQILIPNLISSCPNLTAGNYTMKIPSKTSAVINYGPGGSNMTLDSLLYTEYHDGTTAWFTDGLPVIVSGSGPSLSVAANTSNYIYVLYNNNNAVSAADGFVQNGNDYKRCNYQGNSPIVIEKAAGAGIQTSNPLKTSDYFDTSGSGTKDRISCVKGGAYLALPDANGKINNVNQLFGNKTVGPDGKGADNGYLALGKYDNKKVGYGMLTSADPIWSKLRLWEDTNCDGIAQPSEIMPLSAYYISAIRWGGAVNEIEHDAYGNETRERNTVYQYTGGSLRSFDLWYEGGY